MRHRLEAHEGRNGRRDVQQADIFLSLGVLFDQGRRIDDQRDMHVRIVEKMDMPDVLVSELRVELKEAFAVVADGHNRRLREKPERLQFIPQFPDLPV